MGAGKSAVARALGEKLKTTVADLDARIAERSGCSVAEVFARDGESAFREREHEALEQATLDGSGVIACGGGIVLLEANRTLLAQGCRTVWLDVEVKEATFPYRSTATMCEVPETSVSAAVVMVCAGTPLIRDAAVAVPPSSTVSRFDSE